MVGFGRIHLDWLGLGATDLDWVGLAWTDLELGHWSFREAAGPIRLDLLGLTWIWLD